ncbi:aminodeoxychorismate lyase [Microbacterium aurantiacum]|uniref:aminodeoxychorismate lyase n=1 Tax=Microbacterium aurantiacum TaxID=162393 RepID=UPI00341E91E1
MAWRFALALAPVASDDAREDFSDTFRPLDPGAPALPVGELSAQRGDGVFESLGVVDRHPQEVGPHLERLAASAALCDLPAPNPEQWRQAIRAAAAHAPITGEGVLKLILSRGVEHGATPTAWVTVADAADNSAVRERGIRLVTLDRGYALDVPTRAPWLLLGAKTLSYAVNMAAIREAKRRGADDALFVSSDGFLLEAPTANLILRIHGRFVTPLPAGGILHGTTQRSVFAHLERSGHDTAYEAIPVADLAKADAAWLVSSVRLAAPVTAVDGIRLAVDAPRTADLNRHLLSRRD